MICNQMWMQNISLLIRINLFRMDNISIIFNKQNQINHKNQ